MKSFLLIPIAVGLVVTPLLGEPRVYSEGKRPDDKRLGDLKDLNGDFTFEVPKTKAAWEERAEELRRRLLVANGLWPLPDRTPLNPVIHGKVERDGFTVEKVYFESVPGFFVTGLLFRPEKAEEPYPGVLSPHGHGGRLQDHGEKGIRKYLVTGAERFENSGRFPKVARCAQLARMGCATFLFDMIGYADNQQLSYELAHRFAEQRSDFDAPDKWGLYSTQAELRLQSIMGLQTWNAIRALDFLESLPDVDANRLAVTGGSGGGTQTILLCALDPRPVAAFPQGMVSVSMQGGCTCENTSLLRIGTGNVELTALFAPKPQAMTAANDWTKAMMTNGYPQLQKVYGFYDAQDKVFCSDLTHFPHNYNYVTRAQMYTWFNKHLQLGLEEPIVEEDFKILSAEDHAVWNADHPKPEGGDAYEVKLTRQLDDASAKQLAALKPNSAATLKEYRDVVGGAWEVLIGRSLPDKNDLEQLPGDQVEHDGYLETRGILKRKSAGEEFPVAAMIPTENNNEHFVLWMDGDGKQGLYGDDGKAKPPVGKLLAAGFPVVSADLFMQGEFVSPGSGNETSRNRVVENKREYAGYTYGYNHPLFAQRVHDVLTLIGAVEQDAEEITLVGVNGAGPLVAAAAALAHEALDRVAVDTKRFRFTQLKSYRDAAFLSGAVKYGGLDGMLSLVAPKPLWLGSEESILPMMAATYQAAEGTPQIHLAEDASIENLSQWLITTTVKSEETP